MRQTNLVKTLLLLLTLVGGVNVAWADTAIPLTVGTYLTTSESATTGTINNDDGGNLGRIQKGATATFTRTNASAQDMVLTFLTGNNNDSSPQVTVTMNDGNSDFFTKTVDIENTGSWTPVTRHTFDVGTVPAGTVTLTFAFTNTSSYVCNLGSIGLYSKTAYIATLDAMPGNVTLANGTYKTARVESGGNVGYMSNGATAYYPLYATTGGAATLNIGMVYYGDGTLNVQVTDLSTGTVEVDKDLSITSAVCSGLDTPTSFELGDITAGFKAMKFTVTTSASYLCNYKNVSLAITPSNWSDIAIDLRSGQLGTATDAANSKYLTIGDGDSYSYADAEPENYNAYLTSTRFNSTSDTSHGYVSFKAKVPVGAGIYKITLGTCQYGTGTGYVKNADESSTLNVVDENGQAVSSFNQNNGTCYHQNTTDNVVSVWYTATSDETITVVCGNYTPYFAIERVESVPEMQYTVTYVNDTDGAMGTVPAVVAVSDGNSITIPANRTLYKDGYTLTGWNDGTTTHAIGSSFTPTVNTTLTAVFTANTYTIAQTLSEITVHWDFQTSQGAPTVQWQNRTGDFLVAQTTVNGSSIDVKLDINTTSGKFNNAGWTDWCQVNEGTIFTFPSVNGTTVTAYSMNEPKNGSNVKSDLDGNEYSTYSSNTASYSTTSTSGSSTLTIKGGTYYRYIEVTYPVTASITGITALTVDGTALGGDIIAAINQGDSYTATLTGNVYTTLPTVVATFDDNSTATATATGSGTTRAFTVTGNVGGSQRTFTLNVEGIHIYAAGANDEDVQLKYTSDGVSNNVWSNGLYSLSPVGDGWNNSGFKLAKNNGPFTLSVPSDVKVKQFIIREFIDNYTAGSFNAITSTGMTAYIPTEHDFGYSQNGGGGHAKYDLVINLENHSAGQPIVFSFTGGSQITGWYELTVEKQNPGTAPVKSSESVTVVNNHAVVAVGFDREIASDVSATINGGTVTAEGGSSTLYFPVWNLNYSTNYTLTIAADAVTDTYGNSTAAAIEVAVNVPAKAAVTAAAYDYVVGTAAEFSTAVAAVNSSNSSSSATRKTIFIKNGDYDFGSTEQRITGYNVSLIGESRDGVILHGNRTGISNPVLNIRDRSGFYLQDLTVKNDYDYGTGAFNGVAVAIYGGDKTVMKNVRMLSNQDTQVTGHRAYFEECEIHGTVDFICGGGDNFYYQTDLMLENRGGNCITAPSTNSSQKWGYVFQQCTISGVDATAATTNSGSYNLGRPWQNEPRCYFLNTTMEVLPTTGGWTSMGTLPTHFYEYNSMNASGSALDLSGRTNSPTSTNSYTPVLTAAEAAKFTVENVLGGTDSWLPTDYTTVMAAPTVSVSDGNLTWTAVEDARCYVIFKNGAYLTNQTGTSYVMNDEGIYTVRAANEMGGLGAASTGIVFKRTIKADRWNTIVLPFDIASTDIEKVFGTGASVAELNSGNATTLTFTTELTDSKMKANQPYAIKVGSNFSSATITGVIADYAAEPKQTVGNWQFVGTYTSGNIPEGSYFFSDNQLWQAEDATNTINPFRAWFTYTGTTPARSLNFVIDGEDATSIGTIKADGTMDTTVEGAVFNMAGQRVAQPTKGLYIVNGKKVILK